ncbi:signal recognition particle-docking protein FtsY [Paenibacillus sp. FSL W8-0187]|jgi:fused signal recognition particle receptor|uniref:signal recognition particle-docking protein FtsY n=1 Tax=Paenibacillus TaxID=44249 RepID=UPI000BF9873F|nr:MULTISPECIES: signal recognition particle-docking protein FtsY [Paenibacillus]MCV4232209.1 signal recognition particle-docking protein FtsY [Virgibacillus sp. LDC1]MBT2760986.1 signal recognition particle-docking protein FtsY [Paenibacillus sp. ISL-20]MEC0202083.1 signal recognition particle-docking protein FtsY [Paenibacillus lautus]MEC0257500.1 signal recognition particle-docking protein FtsY [Paenibacillus lautus]MEC0308061.1 signal recognition particle-docking protein FtsY [Paenibacillu
MSFFKKLKESISSKTENVTKQFRDGLEKTRKGFIEKVSDLVIRRKKIDEEFYEELEEILIGADVGVNTVMDLMDDLRAEVKKRRIEDAADLQPVLSEKLMGLLRDDSSNELRENPDGITVILFVGVNGVGKTTTIGKLAHRYKQEGKKVLLAAGDTFRAGAIEQLEVWGERVGVEVIKQQPGSDPAAVMFDAVQAAKQRQADVLLCDTAGRLQNKTNLMEELNKIFRVIQREIPSAPHEVLMVLDATTGQNALSQAKLFGEKSGVTGLVLTKLDGTAKGGIVIAIRQELNLPVKLVGLGEKMGDLQTFDSEQFVHALFAGLIKEEENAVEQQD